MYKLVLGLVMLVSLQGCFFDSKTATEFKKEMDPQGVSAITEQATTASCLQWVGEKEKAELAAYATMDSSDKADALRHRETMGMIKDVWGKGNECKPGTNMWDAYIVHVKETETSHREYAGAIKSVATAGVYGYAATNITKAVVGAVGDKFSTTGENATIAKTTTTTNTNSHSTAVATDKSTATSSNQGGGATPAGTEKGSPVVRGELFDDRYEDCTTITEAGRDATVEEANTCMNEYGYATEIQGGKLFLDGSAL